MTEPLDVCAFMAHPDDAALLCGGALIRSFDAGERTGVVDLTAGEAGSSGTPESRAREARAASLAMGLAERRCAGLPDAQVRNDQASRVAVVELLRELRPRVVVTHWVRGRHPDHRVAAELVRDAAFLSGLRNFPAGGEPHRPEKVVYALSFREDAVKPSFVVDVTDQMERKIEALVCYESQFAGKAGIGEVFPGGDRPLFEQIRIANARSGSLIRCAYGEPFWTAEVVQQDTLGQLSVSTF